MDNFAWWVTVRFLKDQKTAAELLEAGYKRWENYRSRQIFRADSTGQLIDETTKPRDVEFLERYINE